MPVLHPERLVVAVDVVEVGDLELGGLRTEGGSGLASGDELAQEEDDERHPEDHDDRLERSSDDVAEHVG